MAGDLSPDEQILALVARHYEYLRLAGEQRLALNPIVNVTAPAQALVLWTASGNVLEGYDVSKFDRDALFPEGRLGFERIGFGPDAQRAGFWVLQGVRYEPRGGDPEEGWGQARSTSHLFASYDAMGKRWSVVRLKPGPPPRDPWTDQWQPMTGDLTGTERAVIARVARETELLLDAAATLQGDHRAKSAFERVLTQCALESADPGDERRIGAILQPFGYLPRPVANQFRVSALGTDLAGPLYRALAGKAPRDSTTIMATATVTEATLCPPYEPADFRLSRSPRSAPPASRPRPGRTAKSRSRRLGPPSAGPTLG